MRYVPYEELDGVPHVVVDGSPRPDTLLTLSHWPRMPAPAALRDDLSAQMAFHYLEQPELAVPAEAVSNNHLDQDGLVSVYALVDPESAFARRIALIDVARAGDFGRFESREAARVSTAIAALARGLGDADRYPPLLERLPELVDHPDRFEALWREEDAHLAESEAAVADGTVTIEELPALDLAVVTVPDAWAERQVHRFTLLTTVAVHPMAINNATDCFRVLYRRGHHYELQLRYETWIQYVSRRPLPRPALEPFAAELAGPETSGGTWTFDGAGAMNAALHLLGAPESSIPPEDFVDLTVAALCRAAPGWDPYA